MGTSKSLGEFARKIDLVADKTIPSEVTRVIRKIALAIDQVTVLATPVDTGRARANWIVTVRGPSTGSGVQPSTNGERGSEARGAANAQRSLNAGSTVISQYDDEKHAGIFITNNLPYIEFLEEGSSAQAPEGMLKQGLNAGLQVAKQERIRIVIR